MVAELPFSYLHVFRFSRRARAPPAADMPDQVHPETITRRSAILRDLAEQQAGGIRAAAWWAPIREAVIEAESDLPGLAPGHHRQLRDRHGARRRRGLVAGTLVKVRID